MLDRHYIPTRYPDALPEGSPYEAFGPEDADDAINRTDRLLRAVEQSLVASQIPSESPPAGDNDFPANSSPSPKGPPP